MPAEIHSLRTYRELKGEPVPKLHRFDPAPAEPIPFARRAFQAFSGFVSDFTSAKQRRDDLVMNFSPDVLEDRQSSLLDKWMDDTVEMCGPEKTLAMLKGKSGLAEAIIEARK